MKLTPDSIRRLRGLIRKEFIQAWRDPSSILIAFLLPTFLMFLFGYGVSLDLYNIRMGVVIKNVTPEAVDFLQSFTGSTYFNTQYFRDPRPPEDMLVAGRLQGLAVLPVDFTEKLKRDSDIAPIQVIADASEPNTASLIVNYTQQVWNIWMHEANQSVGLVSQKAKIWFNQELESRDSLLPGSLPTIVMLVGTLLTGLVVAREWDRGTMEALVSTPVTITEILISKFIPYFILAMGTMYLCTFIMTGWFHVPFRGSLIALTIVTAFFLLNALGYGLLISTLSKNQFAASQAVMLLSFTPSFLLSGSIFDITSMPRLLQVFTSIIAARYFVSCLRTLFLAGDVWSLLIANVISMSVLAGIVYVVLALRSTKRLE